MPKSQPLFKPRLTNVALIVALVLASVPMNAAPVLALSPNIVISQVYGGGGNTGATYTHDFVELFNRGTTSVSLAGWSVQYTSATGTGNFGSSATQLTELPALTLTPGQYLLIQEAQGSGGTTPLPTPDVTDASPIAMSGTGGKVALVNTTTPLGCNGGSTPCSAAALATIVDLVGWDGANFFEGSGPAPATTNTTAILRNNSGCSETDNNNADFTAGAPTPRNTASPLHYCVGPTNPTGVGTATPASVPSGGSTLLTVSVTPGDFPPSTGLGVTGDLTSLGGVVSQIFIDDGTNGDVTAGDNVFSFQAVVPAGTSGGAKTLPVTITDAEGRTGNATINLTVIVVIPIGEVQGVTADAENGLTDRSPFAPASGNSAGSTTVTVQGVIYEKTLARTSTGGTQNGFFIQNTPATVDSDPNSSDGIFVFMGSAATINRAGGGTYTPQAGDEIVLSGRVSEFFFLSQISSSLSVVQVVRSGVDLNAEVAAFDVNPPDNLADANRYWERREGMRAQVPAGSVVIDSSDVFPTTADAEVWLARGDSDIALRSDAYERRAFRDPHPLDNDPANLFDDGNGYRIILGSLGVKAAAGDNTVLLNPARTFDTMYDAPIGGVYFSFNKYQIMVEQQPDFTPGVDPSLNAPPQAFNRAQEYSLATYNVENLYDYRDDPFDGCDFVGNAGCPGVTPPFNYVPASEAVYQAHLNDIAQQIISDLHGPDIIFVQEAEDQDICSVSGGALVCGAVNNADGKPDTLQELAVTIAGLGGPAYEAANDRDGADDRGIVSAFLFRADRVELLPASASDPVLGNSPTVSYRGTALSFNTDVQNPKALNADLPSDVDTSTDVDGSNVFTRPPQVGLFRVWRNGVGDGTYIELYALSNHFSSTPDARVGQRKEQALYDAAIVAALQAADADVRVAVGGDFNVYPRPDDPFAPGHPLFPSDQLAALYDQGLINLFDTLVAEVPASAYSYIFQGQTQTLDQLYVTPSLFGDLVQVRVAHVNSDWPADFGGDGPRGASDHDPQVARFCRDVTGPALNVTVTPDTLWPPNHQYVTVEATVVASDDADPDVVVTLVSVTSNEPDEGPGDGKSFNDIVIVDEDTFLLRAERMGGGQARVYTITYQAVDDCGNVTVATATVIVPKKQGN